MRRLQEMYGFRNSFEIPVLEELSTMGDTGVPAVVSEPAGIISKIYSDIASLVVREVSRLKFGAQESPEIKFIEGQGISIQIAGESKMISAQKLRSECRCAACVEEFTGEQILDKKNIPIDIHPTDIHPMGNYAVSVLWSDGHTSSVYPYEVLKDLSS